MVGVFTVALVVVVVWYICATRREWYIRVTKRVIVKERVRRQKTAETVLPPEKEELDIGEYYSKYTFA